MCNTCDNLYSQPTKLVNLHVHSCYSLLDGLGKVEDIFAKVKKMGQTCVALTEHGNVFSAIKASKLAKEYSIKYIYGIEFYVTKDRFVKDRTSKYNHLTVLAKNEQGRININKLSSLGYLEGFYHKPRVDHALLKQHKDGLIVLSGCMASEIQQALAGGKIGDSAVEITDSNYEKAKEIVIFYRNIFGKDYYLEVQSHSDIRQQKLNRAIVDIAKELNIPFVVTADSHFVDEEDYELHGIFIQIGTNREAGETYLDTQLQSELETRKLLGLCLTDEEVDEAIRNTSIIADMCNVHIPLSEPIIPKINLPQGYASQAEYLKKLCNEGWIRREINRKPNKEEYHKRLMFEYDAVTKMGFEGYYLLVEGYANSVERRGIARGSGGGSLIAYLLNIVDIDPIEYGLYFERFIDVGALDLLESGEITRKELKIPDVDLDFGREDREKVIQTIIDEYGEKHFVALGQFGIIWDKTAIKDVGKVLGISFDETNSITKLMDSDTIKESIENGSVSQYVEKYPKLFDYASKLAGIPKSFGIHPCGRAVTIEEATNYSAIAVNDGTIVLQGDMNDAEDLGIVKIDTLGLRTVDVIYDTLEMIGKEYDYIAPHKIDFKDEEVLKLFCNGETNGIFQFESVGMQSTLKKMQPNGLDDLGAANALFRPGSMKFIDNYINRKNGLEDVTYLHSDLEDILKVTYGIIVFQEQLIEIGKLAGMRNPDLLRQATGKKDIKKMNKAKPELVSGLLSRGWTNQQIEELWEIMLEFAKYSFNKSHSYAYAIIAYITAFLKVHHPLEFTASLLNSYISTNSQDKYERISKIYREAVKRGIEVELPTLQNISDKCQVVGNKVVYGIKLVKTTNDEVSKGVKSIPSNIDNAIDLFRFILEETSINKSQTIALIRLNVFNNYGNDKYLVELYDQFMTRYKKTHKDNTKEKRLLELKEFEEELDSQKAFNINERISFEVDKLGFPISTDKSYDKSFGVVLDVNTKYSPVVNLYNVSNGEEHLLKVSKQKFFLNKEPLLINGDLINVKALEQKYKQRLEEGKWVRTNELQLWMNNWELISRIAE